MGWKSQNYSFSLWERGAIWLEIGMFESETAMWVAHRLKRCKWPA